MRTDSPFVGPRPHDTADAAVFHGRAKEAAALAGLWRNRRLTVLHGPSGVGKTSLLRAGVLPRFGARSAMEVLPVGRPVFPADFPLAALPDPDPLTFGLLSSWYPEESPARVLHSSISGLLRRGVHIDQYGGAAPVLAAIDDADLLFRGGRRRDGHRARFFAELAEGAAAAPRLHLLITVRTENLRGLLRMLGRAGFPAMPAARFRLGPLRPGAAREAVRGPIGDPSHPLAACAGELVDELARGEPGVDPALLQIVCARLWSELGSAGAAGIASLPEALDQVLRDHCLGALTTAAERHGRLPSGLVERFRDAFGGDGGDAARALPGTVLRSLEDLRLLAADRRAGERRHRLRQARLRPVVRRLRPAMAAAAPAAAPRLDVAEAAFTAGDLALARRQARAVAAGAAGDPRLRGAAACLLGTIACLRDDTALAVEHYDAAANDFGAVGDTVRVGVLLAAIGRLKMGTGDAVNRLQAALARLPGDLLVRTVLAQALWYAGRPQAAIAVLDDALSQDGGTPEALRLRGELLADLDRAEPALRDLGRIDHLDRPSTRAAWALASRTRERGAGLSPADERELVEVADDSGPVLLRVARILRLGGQTDTAAGLARRAVMAQRPPLPVHLRKEAERLMSH